MSYFTANGNITDAVSEMARELKEIEEKSAEFVVNVRKTMKELGVRMFDNNSAIKLHVFNSSAVQSIASKI